MELLFESTFGVIKELGVAGFSILVVVLVLIAFIKQFKNAEGEQKVQGNDLLIIGFGIGFVMGGLAYVANNRPPVDGDWYVIGVYCFIGLLYGLMTGVAPSGAYELAFRKETQKEPATNTKE